MSATIINGVPYINGKPARYDPMSSDNPLRGALSDYRCPECNARLGVEHQICLNACHLTAASYRRFLGGFTPVAKTCAECGVETTCDDSQDSENV